MRHTALVLVAALVVPASLWAAPLYEPGLLQFSTTGQSMWGTGESTSPVSNAHTASWSASTTVGGIAGSAREQVTPEIPSVQLTPRIPAVYGPRYYQPRVYNIFTDRHSGCGCWKRDLISGEIPATYSPHIPATYADTRTGTEVEFSTSGQIGVRSSLGFTDGTVDVSLDFAPSLSLPEVVTQREFFSFTSTNGLVDGEFESIFPTLTGTLDLVFNARIDAEATGCLVGAGCDTSRSTLLDWDIDAELLEVHTEDLPPDTVSLFGIDQVPFDLSAATVFADLSPTGVVISLPGIPQPPIAVNLGHVTLDYPTIGIRDSELDNAVLSASETAENVIELFADVDTLGTALGATVPGGVVLNAGLWSFRGDLIDIDFGPTLDISQSFSVSPELMLRLEFSEALYVETSDGGEELISYWSGALDDLPRFALASDSEVTITPTWWLDVELTNQTAFSLEATGALDVLKGRLALSLLAKELCLLCDDLIEIPLTEFDAFNEQFALGGFAPITTESFLLRPGETPNPSTNRRAVAQVPVPSSLALVAIALLGLIFSRRSAR
ncbi:MAG: PEP-CTERM sorting domain-containing protein [Pseudomonadota bacterium]